MGAVVDVEAPLDPGGGPDGGVGSGMLAAIVELVDPSRSREISRGGEFLLAVIPTGRGGVLRPSPPWSWSLTRRHQSQQQEQSRCTHFRTQSSTVEGSRR